MTLWLILAVMLLLALLFVAVPLLRGGDRSITTTLVSIVAVVVIAAGLYAQLGSPNVPSGAGSEPDVEAMVASLAERLESEPDDINGWLMLGRSYQAMQRFDESISAHETAMRLEGGQNAQTMVSLALVVLEKDNGGMSGRAISLLENALALEPSNPNALFYGGLAAANRGDTHLAASRWETLKRLDAPPEIQTLLQQKIDEWRGLESSAGAPSTAASSYSETINIRLSVADVARADFGDDATVFVIARDPTQPSPPVAVTRRRLSELPIDVALTDRDAMVPGRAISNFADLEIVARISKSGQPMQQPGDWYGSVVIDNRSLQSTSIVIDQVVTD